jgi:hypothetical protein
VRVARVVIRLHVVLREDVEIVEDVEGLLHLVRLSCVPLSQRFLSQRSHAAFHKCAVVPTSLFLVAYLPYVVCSLSRLCGRCRSLPCGCCGAFAIAFSSYR